MMESNGFYINEENRQHINLSNYAMDIIQSDMIKFNQDYDLKNKSGFINKIISNYYDKFPLSLAIALKQMNIIKSTLSNEDFSKKLTDTIIHQFSKEIMKNLILEYKSKFQSENQFKMKLNIMNAELFESLEEARYFDEYAPRSGISFYLKILLESYTRLTITEREQVYFGEIFRIIRNSIKNKTFLKLKDDNKYIKVTPIFIHKTAKQQYHELVYTEDEGESKKILNMNIKDIKIVRELKEKSTVDNSLRELVHDKMKEFFNRGSYKSKKEFVIKFTKYGLERFILEEDLLPIIGIPNKDDKHLYTFNATETDIFNHIFKFGAQAIIINQIDSRKRFEKMYNVAYTEYRKEVELCQLEN